MSQAEAPKVVMNVATGIPPAQIGVSKIVMYVLLVPGDSGDAPPRQAHTYTQIIRRG